MADFQYTPSRKGMQAIANSAGVGEAAVRMAKAGKAYAKSIAPVGKTGDYKNSFEVEQVDVQVPTKGGFETRAGAVLRNTAPYSAPQVEVEHKVLKRTAAHLRGE